MPDERPLVVEGVAADPALLRVVGVLEFGQGGAVVVDAEVRGAFTRITADVGDQRVVGVQDEVGEARARTPASFTQASARASVSP